MWHHDLARRVVQSYIDAATDRRAVILDSATLDKPYGWVFFYQNRAYVETGEVSQLLAGNAPIIFNRVRGEYHVTGTAHPIDYYLAEYEATLPPAQLAAVPQRRDRSRAISGSSATAKERPPEEMAPGVSILEVQPQTRWFDEVITTARVLNQAKYIERDQGPVEDVLLLAAASGQRCIGFLLCLVQIIGREEGRPALRDASGALLREGYVDAFGVLTEYRRRGIGRRLQERAVELCVERDCYQIRSRSPTTSTENYALKLSLGYAAQPDRENDSYYFIRVLGRPGVGR